MAHNKERVPHEWALHRPICWAGGLPTCSHCSSVLCPRRTGSAALWPSSSTALCAGDMLDMCGFTWMQEISHKSICCYTGGELVFLRKSDVSPSFKKCKEENLGSSGSVQLLIPHCRTQGRAGGPGSSPPFPTSFSLHGNSRDKYHGNPMATAQAMPLVPTAQRQVDARASWSSLTITEWLGWKGPQ